MVKDSRTSQLGSTIIIIIIIHTSLHPSLSTLRNKVNPSYWAQTECAQSVIPEQWHHVGN